MFGNARDFRKRDRSLITVAALIALNRTEQLRPHLQRTRDNGVTKDEIVENDHASRAYFKTGYKVVILQWFVPLNMSDKQGQQRRGRADGAIRSAVDRCPVGKDPALAPKRRKRPQGGRPPADDRKVLEGILWILRSGARWCDLPVEFPSPSTCWRRLRDWEEQEVWLEIWRTFLS